MTHNNANVSADPFDDPVTSNKMAIRALIPLLITFVLGTLCLQGFNLVFQQVGADVGAPNQASLITAFPSIVLGIVCFIYGSLGDFVSLRRLVTVGLITLFVGSLFGFIANFCRQSVDRHHRTSAADRRRTGGGLRLPGGRDQISAQ